MRIQVAQIKDEGLALDFSESAADFVALADLSPEVVFLAPVSVRLRVVRVAGMIEVDGSLESLARLTCGRCLGEYELPIEAGFALTFAEELPAVIDEETDEEVELDAEEMGLIPFEGEEIDLREAIQEQVVMALPLRPLCREECRGLCPRCGADLNEGDCGCAPSEFSLKFAALRDFKVNKDD